MYRSWVGNAAGRYGRKDSTPEGTITSSLVVRRPYDPAPALASLVAHAVPGVEAVDGSTVRRVVGGAVVTATLAQDRIDLTSSHGAGSDLRALADTWFGLADDLDAVRDAFAHDEVLGPLVRAAAGSPRPTARPARTA